MMQLNYDSIYFQPVLLIGQTLLVCVHNINLCDGKEGKLVWIKLTPCAAVGRL